MTPRCYMNHLLSLPSNFLGCLSYSKTKLHFDAAAGEDFGWFKSRHISLLRNIDRLNLEQETQMKSLGNSKTYLGLGKSFGYNCWCCHASLKYVVHVMRCRRLGGCHVKVQGIFPPCPLLHLL
jgi:hypothetical protein